MNKQFVDLMVGVLVDIDVVVGATVVLVRRLSTTRRYTSYIRFICLKCGRTFVVVGKIKKVRTTEETCWLKVFTVRNLRSTYLCKSTIRDIVV